jgi:hypothetical protein
MPYTADNLPANVKKLPAKRQRQWMHIVNGCLSDGKPESKCFAMANGVAAKDFTPATPPTLEEAELIWEAKDYQYIDSWEYSDHALPQQAVNYNPIGGTSSEACANCQFWIAPSRCAVVQGTISPTGHSDMWHAVVDYTSPPLPVTIVSDLRETSSEPVGAAELERAVAATVRQKVVDAAKDFGVELATPQSPPPVPSDNAAPKGLLAHLKDLGSRITGSAPAPVPEARAFSVVKQKDGRTRFYTAWSNNFRDREGEIFTAAAHKEFVEWATETGEYPELWLWHTKGSAFGQVDWLDATSDGFVHASGLIHAGKEALAEQLAQEECGVSHGFFGLQQSNLIHWYRSYELSVLPLRNAAVWTTSFNLLNAGKAIEMGFTPEKRAFFAQMGIDDKQISEWEKQTDGLADALKGLGLESKAADLGVQTPPPPSPEEKADADFRVETTKALMAIQETMATLANEVKEIKDKTKDIKSGDAVIAAAMAPGTTQAVQASKSTDNVVAQNANSGGSDDQVARDFFNGTILGTLIGTPTGS